MGGSQPWVMFAPKSIAWRGNVTCRWIANNPGAKGAVTVTTDAQLHPHRGSGHQHAPQWAHLQNVPGGEEPATVQLPPQRKSSDYRQQKPQKASFINPLSFCLALEKSETVPRKQGGVEEQGKIRKQRPIMHLSQLEHNLWVRRWGKERKKGTGSEFSTTCEL